MARKRRGAGRERAELAVLVLAVLAVAAFAASFAAGLELGTADASAPAPSDDAPPAAHAANLPPSDPAAPAGRIRVEVLNGAGTGGIARDATERLRDAGFDVVFFGNAGRFDVEASSVIARTEDVDAARRVADALGIADVRAEPDADLYLDVTVVLGADWAAPAAAPVEAEEEGVIGRVRGAVERWVGREE